MNIHILRLIRLPNLLLLATMQFLLRYAVAIPITEAEGKPHLLNNIEYALLVLSVLCIAAGGYIINDIEDYEIDQINKPGKVVVGKEINKNTAFNLYLVFTLAGIGIGLFLRYALHIQYIAMSNAVCAGLLYFYATGYKCIPVLGNVIIAGLTGFAVWLSILPEPLMMSDAAVLSLTSGYILFAFIMTLIRELIKDIEDVKGDQECGCKTLPVATGITLSKWIAFILTVIVLLLLTLIQMITHQWESPLAFYYLIITVSVPLVALAFYILKAKDAKDWHRASTFSKIIMLTGVLSMAVFYFTF